MNPHGKDAPLEHFYELRYLTRDDRDVYGLKACHLCCFGGLALPCHPFCSILGGAWSYFIPSTHEARVKDRNRIAAARRKINNQINKHQ